MIYLDPHKWYEFPADVAHCPICGAPVLVGDFDEWETENGRVTDCGFHINCKTEPDIDSEEWEGWFRSHWSTPYMDWLPLETRLYRWFDRRFRLRLPTSGAVDGGEGSDLQAESKPAPNLAPEVLPSPAHHH